MKKETRENVQWVTIDPGEYFATDEQVVIATLLGSCVATCLFDPVNRVAGMNHFLLSSRNYNNKTPMVVSEAGRYGVNSMELLINRMLALGADRRYLKAKAFGGGNLLRLNHGFNYQFGVGEANVHFVKGYLKNEKIPLISSALGGENGRVIQFNTSDSSVYVKKIQRIDMTEVERREKKYLNTVKKELKKREGTDSNIDLWLADNHEYK